MDKGPGGLLDYKAMNKKAKEVMTSLGQDVDPEKPAGNLRYGCSADDRDCESGSD
jgi:ribose transport system ATP-binding protein